MYTLRRSWLLIHKFKLQKLKNMSEDWRMSVSLCKWRFWCENTRFCMCKWEKILLVERDCHMAWSLVHRVLWMKRLPSTFLSTIHNQTSPNTPTNMAVPFIFHTLLFNFKPLQTKTLHVCLFFPKSLFL